ncbi:MAG: type II secretion system F family protein [Alphaproteobacteria bacterium]|nr:type II secretion system F family protein [Alphaproteobacteria bacterium]
MQKTASYNNNDKRYGSFTIRYAQIMLKLFQSDRLRIYRKLASLLRNRFSLMDALERLKNIASDNGKKPTETIAVAMTCWMESLQNGMSFSVALRGWAPQSELLMLSVGDIANLEDALMNLIHVVEGTKKMKAPLVGALAYPMFLMFMVVLIIYAVGAYMVPPMVDAVPDLIWRGQARSLVSLSNWVRNNSLILFASLPIIFFVIAWTLPRWKGRLRSRFDNYPPWNLYRIFVGVSWLLSLSALINAGTPVSKALRMLRADSSPYLLYRLERALIYVNNGENLGEALFLTGLGFPDKEVIGDLQIYAELDNFPAALTQMANEWLEDAIRDIEQKAAVLNGIAIMSIALIVAWVVAGTFDMQDQMVTGMG